MHTAFDILKERGFVHQCTHSENELRFLLGDKKITYYAGFDPTADSLHVGSLIPIMAMAHLQKAGHTPLVVIGNGTTLIGDPSGKTDSRPLLAVEQIERNSHLIQEQIGRYLNLSNNQGIVENNGDWLANLNLVAFLRDIGKHFRVNEMLKLETYKRRLDENKGLSFLEFSYILLQAYDFLKLYQWYECLLQIGGADQWANIVAGVELVRQQEGEMVFGLTFPLITTARGNKMGKTEKGTVWLSAERTSPYEFYQYWINVDDSDVKRFLFLFTFLDSEYIAEICSVTGKELRAAKEILAYEVTKLCHGGAEAVKCRSASAAIFQKESGNLESIPTTELKPDVFDAGISLTTLFHQVGLVSSKGAARRLIEQGGAYVNDVKITDAEVKLTQEYVMQLASEEYPKGTLLLRYGKKTVHRIVIQS